MGYEHQRRQADVAEVGAPAAAAGVPAQHSTDHQVAQEAVLANSDVDGDAARLGDLCQAISNTYLHVLLERARGVEELRQDTAVEDAPPAWQPVAIAVGTVALSAATAGVGTAVAAAIAAKALHTSSQITARSVDAIVKTTVEDSLFAGVTAKISAAGNPATNMRDAFFRAQADALHDAGYQAQIAFDRDAQHDLRRSEKPHRTASALLEALEAGRATSKAIQRKHTLASWCNFLARNQLGSRGAGHRSGTDLRAQVGDTSAKGVLGLEITAGRDPREPVTITGAEIEGLNETNRGELTTRPIRELGISVTAHGVVDEPSLLEELTGTRRDPAGRLRIGRNESGTLFDDSDHGARRFLAAKGMGGPVVSGPDGLHGSDRDEFRWNGIRRIIEDEIGRRSLSSIGVDLHG